VLAQDGELLVPIIQHRSPQNPWVKLKSLFSSPALDRDLPQACSAENETVLIAFQDRTRLR
jgi:hypothetical protein